MTKIGKQLLIDKIAALDDALATLGAAQLAARQELERLESIKANIIQWQEASNAIVDEALANRQIAMDLLTKLEER